MSDNIQAIIAKMTLEEKAALCTGGSPWTTTPIERLGRARDDRFGWTAWRAPGGGCERLHRRESARHLLSDCLLHGIHLERGSDS